MSVTYPPCRKCGKSHGMGVEEMSTGIITPIDLCYECLWEGFPKHLKNLDQRVKLSESEEDYKGILERTEKDLLENV